MGFAQTALSSLVYHIVNSHVYCVFFIPQHTDNGKNSEIRTVSVHLHVKHRYFLELRLYVTRPNMSYLLLFRTCGESLNNTLKT